MTDVLLYCEFHVYLMESTNTFSKSIDRFKKKIKH